MGADMVKRYKKETQSSDRDKKQTKYKPNEK